MIGVKKVDFSHKEFNHIEFQVFIEPFYAKLIWLKIIIKEESLQ